MSDLVIPLLVIVLAVCVVNLGVGMILWWRHVSLIAKVNDVKNDLSQRITTLEVYQKQNLTHAETRQIYEELSFIKGRLDTMSRSMQSVQEHLLEKD
ncbi:MAG: hypothetical protein NVV60_01505 [Luteimonas sp.]|nr:hypothetical protein [Luteimonas sp.]